MFTLLDVVFVLMIVLLASTIFLSVLINKQND